MAAKGSERYIWIVRWNDFQHYKPERDRAPAWIKTYTKQLDDDRYTDLPPRRRALLHDLRTAFARTSGQLSDNTRTLSRRVLSQVRDDDIQALNDAGFIELVSRATLEQRLERLYASRAPARSSESEEESEEDSNPSERSEGRLNGHSPGEPLEQLLAWAERDLDDAGRAIKRTARAAPEFVIARVLEAVQGKRPKNRAAYVHESLKRELASQAEIAAKARASLGVDPTFPDEPDVE